MTIRRSLQRQTARQPIDRPSFGLTPTMAAMTLGGTEFAGLSICDWDIKIEPNTFLSTPGRGFVHRNFMKKVVVLYAPSTFVFPRSCYRGYRHVQLHKMAIYILL
ncbi:hypothetical protein CASFOL_011983 [Castilleja foliolosa]|uniref:Uncharacterized protein n=1 Tax=Castilleja foliolosa TaxID=1961234 RepID=A0ABD3DT78_9LAMI